eukprot:CAMPEP_0170581454 /NCGR_PEP_ID=MMETSP0224-20130122/7046_1 /TAXON_ID=285029 /ORGANISM="Togula jolla, Strain CCCM 725" /LENGTH=354 /DNA_ID=CAMNT_0010904587 /DNA_START=62 /DNA_END=1126 /DNA_ORIENTATION=+
MAEAHVPEGDHLDSVASAAAEINEDHVHIEALEDDPSRRGVVATLSPLPLQREAPTEGPVPQDITEEQSMHQGPVTREDLMEQGLSAAQADVMAVRMHEEEVLMEHFRRCIFGFLCFMCMLTPAMFGLLLWLVVSMYLDQEECDVPLKTWTYVVVMIAMYNMTLNRHTIKGSLIVRTCCRWTRDPTNPQPVPRRVRIYNTCLTVFIFSWNVLGLHWAGRSGQDINSDLPACKDVSPNLWAAVKVYGAANLAFTLFMTVFMFGFNRLLREVMYRGLLCSSSAAPKGSLEKNTSEVVQQEPMLCSHPTCPVCLEDFGDLTNIRKTNVCNHYFHTTCLQGWMNVNRTCPICREDLAA